MSDSSSSIGSNSNHFQLSLPSNASMDIYPNNTTAQYRIKLPKHIELSGEWNVSLKEISIPVAVVNIAANTYKFRITDTAGVEPVDEQWMPRSEHITIVSIVAALNGLIKAKYGISVKTQIVGGRRWVRLDLTSNRYGIQMNRQLCELLGYATDRVIYRGRNPAHSAPKLPGLVHNLYVYCDIVDDVIVGDTVAPLLRIVEVTRAEEQTKIHTVVNTPLFVPVQKKSFDTIAIWIMTDFGAPAPFPDDAGKTHIVLEFRKSGLLNNLI